MIPEVTSADKTCHLTVDRFWVVPRATTAVCPRVGDKGIVGHSQGVKRLYEVLSPSALSCLGRRLVDTSIPLAIEIVIAYKEIDVLVALGSSPIWMACRAKSKEQL